MVNKFDIPRLLFNQAGFSKGLKMVENELFSKAKTFKEFIDKGTRLYKQDHLGRWYFMPVTFYIGLREIEFPYAVMTIKGKKTIVETPIVGRKGSVKELIRMDDYTISISGLILSQDGTYPEYEVSLMQRLFQYNDSVEIKSALTDLVLDNEDSVVIKSMDMPSTVGLEDGQVVNIECVTDRPLELIVD